MKSERYGLAGVVIRRGAVFSLYALFGIQFASILTSMIGKLHSSYSSMNVVVFIACYPIPLLAGISLQRFLKRAMDQGEMAAKWRYLCGDWVTLLLISSYVCLVRFSK